MALSAYKAETREVSLPESSGGPFLVKGLSLTDITQLVRYHMSDLEALFELGSQVLDGRKELTEDDINLLVVTFTEQAPGFVANLIALAEVDGSKDEAATTGAASLPFPIQVNCIMDIVELTFNEVGGIKKAFGRIAALMKSPSLTKLTTRMAAR